MLSLHLIRKFGINNISNFANAVTALVTIVILSMDLGVCYTDSEKAFYKHPVIQLVAVFCVSYEIIKNLSISTVIVFIWFLVKYFSYFKPNFGYDKTDKN